MLVKMLIDAGSFNESNYLADLLGSQPSLSSKHISKIYSALETNFQGKQCKIHKKKIIPSAFKIRRMIFGTYDT